MKKRILIPAIASLLAGAALAQGKPARMSPKCLKEIETTLAYAEKEELPPTRRSAVLPVECQYHQFKELDESLRNRIQAYLGSIGKSAHLDQKLTEILTLLKSQSLKRAADAPPPPSQNWLFQYNSKNCADYTGRPLQECEARHYKTYSVSDCDSIIEYATRCKNIKQCNPHFKPGKTCVQPRDFAPKQN